MSQRALFMLERVGDTIVPKVYGPADVIARFGSSRNDGVVTVGQLIHAEVLDSEHDARARAARYLERRERDRKRAAYRQQQTEASA